MGSLDIAPLRTYVEMLQEMRQRLFSLGALQVQQWIIAFLADWLLVKQQEIKRELSRCRDESSPAIEEDDEGVVDEVLGPEGLAPSRAMHHGNVRHRV